MKNFHISAPAVMGILNVTPDSFYDGGKYQTEDEMRRRIEEMIRDGARIIDVGGESSRPGSLPVITEEEIKRISHVVPMVKRYPDVLFSIDTWKPEVAEFAINHGFSMINDITGGGESGEMFKIAAKSDVMMVIMHMQGVPETMQENPKYSDVMSDIVQFFTNQIGLAKSKGVPDDHIILDPGIGFGKRKMDNFKIINSIPKLKEAGYPILIGVSRKSFLCIEDDLPEDRLGASIAAMIVSVMRGSDIIRVHDVRQTVKALNILDQFDL